MRKRITRVLSYIKERNVLVTLIFFGVILFLLLTNTLHESYPDEFDNILGGWYTLQGKLIYRDWFTHHNPIAYWIAAAIEIFSGQSFVKFRFIYAGLLFAFFLGTYLYFKRYFGYEIGRVYLVFLVVLSVASTYFWGQMLLADNIAAYLLTPVFGILFYRTVTKKPLLRLDLIIISVFTFLALFSSLTYAFLVAGIYLYTAYYYLVQTKWKLSKSLLSPILIFAIPYLLLFFYFIVTGSLTDYLFQAIEFNGKYYVYNYPGHQEGQNNINPIRYAIVIFYNFFSNFTVLLNQASSFNFSFPFNITLALANSVMIVYLILRKKFVLAAFLFFYMVYSNVRSNPLTSKETDYQSAVYIVLSLFNGVFVLYEMYQFLKTRVFDVRKIIVAALFIVLGIYSFFTSAYLLRAYGEKTYNKFMGFAPAIYDRPTTAPILNSITNDDEYVWIGPFEFEELFYTNREVPSRFQIIIPGLGINSETQRQIIQDFDKNKPVVMYYNRNFFIHGRSPATYATEFNKFVDENYTNIADIENRELQAISVHENYDLQTNLYIRNDMVEEVVERMTEHGFLTNL